jgi:signal transduction histidine kinase/ActR/RegA family two-component response regulator
MTLVTDLARLNAVIELFSECANTTSLDTLLRVAARRLQFVVPFERCAFALERPEGRVCWVATRDDEDVRRVMLTALPEPTAALLERVLASGVLAADVPGAVCVPLQVLGRTLGALCVTTPVGESTLHDVQLGHHVGQYLGSLISRMDLEEETRRFGKRKDDLLALLSHELRNPLAPIVTAVHLLKMRSVGQPTRELDIIERQAQHLVRLVDDLLDVARLTRGKIVLERAPIEISEVVAIAVGKARPLLDERRHTLRVDVPAVGLIVDADRNRLAQVVSNLLNNAAVYTEAGGHLGVEARRDGDAVVIDVSDDGIGIASDALANIFDPFVQGPSRSSGRGELGLGLVVVKELTELHGGSVAVASAGSGQGATFTVRLPGAGSSPGARSASIVVPGGEIAQRVLLVDDNEDALELLSMLVESEGHEVAVARDGLEALALLEQFLPSVAIIDMSMPVMDGCELATRIRARTSGVQPYLVALTGYGQVADRDRTRVAGFSEHLVKPVDLARLLRVIARATAPVVVSVGVA